VYYFFELYTDGDALGVHGKGDGMKAAMGKFAGLLGGRPEITMMSPVVAKGMDI
jgi:quinol monooxygenase YgiN